MLHVFTQIHNGCPQRQLFRASSRSLGISFEQPNEVWYGKWETQYNRMSCLRNGDKCGFVALGKPCPHIAIQSLDIYKNWAHIEKIDLNLKNWLPKLCLLYITTQDTHTAEKNTTKDKTIKNVQTPSDYLIFVIWDCIPNLNLLGYV